MTRPHAEPLEARRHLAGDVAASMLPDGTLYVRGDGRPNYVYLQPGDVPGTVRVIGSSTTTVNGVAAPATFAGVTGLSARMGLGDDTLLADGRDLPGDVRISAGPGGDRVAWRRSNIGGSLRAEMGMGGGAGDALAVSGSTIGGDVLVRTDRGTQRMIRHPIDGAEPDGTDPYLAMSSAARVRFSDVTVGGDAVVNTAAGLGDDVVELSGSSFARRTAVLTGSGTDLIARRGSTFAGGVKVLDGPGRDRVIDEAAVAPAPAVEAAWDFRDGQQAWRTGFSEWFSGVTRFDHDGRPLKYGRETYELQADLAALPPELNTEGTGLRVHWHNESDDVFAFLNRHLGPEDGVVPGQAYQVEFELKFATNVPDNLPGAGGSPGSVYVKAGAVAVEPKEIYGPAGGVGINVDKGNQAIGGPAASVAGDIVNDLETGTPEVEGRPFRHKTLRHTHSYATTADASGNVWLLIGGDSGHEGRTTLYWESIKVRLVPLGDEAAQ